MEPGRANAFTRDRKKRKRKKKRSGRMTMICRSDIVEFDNIVSEIVTVVCCGKGQCGQMDVNTSNLPTSSNLVFCRLDGCNPHAIKPRPTSQPFSCAPAYTRVYRGSPLPHNSLSNNIKNRLDGWTVGRDQYLSGFERPTLPSNLLRLDE